MIENHSAEWLHGAIDALNILSLDRTASGSWAKSSRFLRAAYRAELAELAELPDHSDPWPAINRERWRLIVRSVEDTFTPLERQKLDALEAYADAHLEPLEAHKERR